MALGLFLLNSLPVDDIVSGLRPGYRSSLIDVSCDLIATYGSASDSGGVRARPATRASPSSVGLIFPDFAGFGEGDSGGLLPTRSEEAK